MSKDRAPRGYIGKHVPGGSRDVAAQERPDIITYISEDGKSGAVTSRPKESDK